MNPRPLALTLAVLAALAGCERPPSADKVRPWSPADHDRAEEQSSVANGAQAPPAKGSDAGGETLSEITWQQACMPCHGPVGHGDGPNGPMVQAPDITRDDLQAKITDEDIAGVIKNGKNRMPKFDLPDSVVRGLVARIRANRGR